jgi:hypothetical protein
MRRVLELNTLLHALNAKKSGAGWKALCPKHDDKNTPNLSISVGEKQDIVAYCFVCGQVYDWLLESYGVEVEDDKHANDKTNGHANGHYSGAGAQSATEVHPSELKLYDGRTPSDYYPYKRLDKTLCLVVARYDGKDGKKEIRQWTFDGRKWIGRGHPEPRPLYRLPELAVRPNDPVIVAEGEKAANAARRLFMGHVATTWAQGASCVGPNDWKPLAGRTVYLLPDNDEAGFKAMNAVHSLLAPMGCTVWQVNPPAGAPYRWDVADTDWTPEQAKAWLETAVKLSEPERPAIPAAEFLASVKPPQWIIEGIIQTEQVYAITAAPNNGKTAVALYMAMCIASGTSFGSHAVKKKGRVLYLCGDDSYGFGARLSASLEQFGNDRSLVDQLVDQIDVVPRSFGMADEVDEFVKSFARRDYSAVITDTSIAYFAGDAEDDNVQAHKHASSLRKLTQLGGCVIVLCHPVKDAVTKQRLLPRGGSAFLGEIDANLTLMKDGERLEFHFERKIRGPEFEPISFELVIKVISLAGVQSRTIVATAVDEERDLILLAEKNNKIKQVLDLLIQSKGPMSIRKICTAGGFLSQTGQPQVSLVQRVLEELQNFKLVRHTITGHEVTDLGVETRKKLKG